MVRTGFVNKLFALAIIIALAAVAVLGLPVAGQAPTPTPTPTPNPTQGQATGAPPEVSQFAQDWPLPNKDYSNTRTATDSPINSSNVNDLEVAWSFPLEPGQASSNPLIVGNAVYFQDLNSNIYALDKATGQVKWEKEYNEATPGPNGPSVGWGKIFAAAGTSRIVALDAGTGQEIWSTGLPETGPNRFTIQPVVYDGMVYVASTGGAGEPEVGTAGGRIGTVYALAQETGKLVWKLETVTEGLWGNPEINSGSGSYFPPAIDTGTGEMFWGTTNPAPFPGTEQFPNGSSRPGPNLYTNSMLAVDHKTGELEWFFQVYPHDLFNFSLAISPVLASANISGKQHDLVIGTGKVGKVYAFDREAGSLLWVTVLGRHENDQLAAVPDGETIRVYPGDLGGVETAMAVSEGTLYVPSSDNCADVTPSRYADADPFAGTGLLTAIELDTGKILWEKRLESLNIGTATVVNDLVFLGTLGGRFMALNRLTGEEVWTYESVPGINGWAAVSGDTIVTLAAADGAPALVAFKLNPNPTQSRGTWQQGASMPSARSEVTATTLNGKVYVIGGLAPGGGALKLVEAYDPVSNTWERRADLPRALHHSAAASLGGKIYVLGGLGEAGAAGDVFEYDPASDTWRARTPMSTPRGAHAAAVVGEKIYLIGGVGSDSNNIATLEVYTPSPDSWEVKSSMPTARDHLAVGVVNGKIYAIGGRLRGDFSTNQNTNEEYDPETDKWTEKAPLPTERSGIAAGVVGSRIFVFGGENPERTFADNEGYNPVADSWLTYAPMPTARHGLAAAVVSDTVYVIGGGISPGSSDSRANEAFTP